MHQLHAPASKNLMPLAIGLVTAFQKKDPSISKAFNFELKVLREDPIDTVDYAEKRLTITTL